MSKTHLVRPITHFLIIGVMILTVFQGLFPTGNASASSFPSGSTAPAPTTNKIKIELRDAKTGDLVSMFRYIINEDNVGDPSPDLPHCRAWEQLPDGTYQRDPLYPEACDWPGIHTTNSYSQIATQGDQTDFDPANPLTNGYITLENGKKYLVSVKGDDYSADLHYKIDGEHFSIPAPEPAAGQPAVITVLANKEPLPSSTMTIKVFRDETIVNGAYDAPVEQGLEGFRAQVNDTVGEVTRDVYGSTLCTTYKTNPDGSFILGTNGFPVVDVPGQGCYSDKDGIIKVPNLAPLRYDTNVVPPDGTNWIQTTTLEGGRGWDTWLNEGSTGLDNEFIVGGEPFPWTIAGFVQPKPLDTAGNTIDMTCPDGIQCGTIKGQVNAALVFTPFTGGLPYQGGTWGGLSGAKIDHPIKKPWVALNDLQNGDTAIYIQEGNADGTFEIRNVPPGNYTLTYWDGPQEYLVDFVNVTVQPAQTINLYDLFLTGWFSVYQGTVFNDLNGNGKQDPGEPGIPNFTLTFKNRDNSLMDRFVNTVTTDTNGRYIFDQAYPIGSWMIIEAFKENYYTTGITYQASNQKNETTILGSAVDADVLPIIGQKARLDWALRPYAPGTNGGIVGTVTYDTMRTQTDPAYATMDVYQPGIPGLTMNLYATVKDSNGNFVTEPDGSYKKGQLLDSTITESFQRTKNCQARDVNGDPVLSGPGVGEESLPTADGNHDCLEGPLMGIQIGFNTGQSWDGSSTVDGNYGFGNVQPGDYLVEVVIPKDSYGRPIYKVTKEEDVNIFDGNVYTPTPNIAPPACAGPKHIVDVKDVGTDGYTGAFGPSTPIENPAFAALNGSPFEGQARNLCDTKLVKVVNQKSVAPLFTLFTDVPIPGRWKGYIIDDLNLSTNPKDLFFGEKGAIKNVPIGVYDFTNRLITTVYSDQQGVFEVLLPSTTTTNVPTPSGISPNIYYIVGNDPGKPGHPNTGYNPFFRTIGASFEIYPGKWEPADLAPTQNNVTVLNPDGTANVSCRIDDSIPQFFAINDPILRDGAVGDARKFTISGLHFGQQNLFSKVSLGDAPGEIPLTIDSWSDAQIVVTVPDSVTPGAYHLNIRANNNKVPVNSVTFHVLGTGYNPKLYLVGPGKTYDPILPQFNINLPNNIGAIQTALNDAKNDTQATGSDALVVVYPNVQVPFTNPQGYHYENLVINSPVKLQGVGPGGVYSNSTGVQGTVIDGGAFGSDSAYTTTWRNTVVGTTTWDPFRPGDAPLPPFTTLPVQTVYEGQVIAVLAQDGTHTGDTPFTDAYHAAIDGMVIQGGNQQGNPQGGGALINGQPLIVQGGGIYVNGFASHLRVTNNIIQTNGGAYGGGIRVGTPDLPEPYTSNHNDHLVISNNRILANGGTNLAGGIGLFAGSDSYEVSHNDICGNFSSEYGGGISHVGLSDKSSIHDNRIVYNRSYDEGGGIMIAGQLPASPTLLSPGSGDVDIYNNLIQANLANDDGGGLRFLMAGGPGDTSPSATHSMGYQFNVYNNIIVNNVSTHEGGGIAINDALDVRISNNTIMNNITTATAMTSNGLPAPAGISTSQISALQYATLPSGAVIFSDPLLFNNIVYGNLAGSRLSTGGIAGIGQINDPTSTLNYWDLGVADSVGMLTPAYSMFKDAKGAVTDATSQINVDPNVIKSYRTQLNILGWRGNPQFINIDIIAVDQPITQLGNYHLWPNSPAINAGIDKTLLRGVDYLAALFDIDGNIRPGNNGFGEFKWDIGADEVPVSRFWIPIIQR